VPDSVDLAGFDSAVPDSVEPDSAEFDSAESRPGSAVAAEALALAAFQPVEQFQSAEGSPLAAEFAMMFRSAEGHFAGLPAEQPAHFQ
jgi:hypothetical protein